MGTGHRRRMQRRLRLSGHRREMVRRFWHGNCREPGRFASHRRGITIPGPFRGRQSCRFLETGSLFPPLAALRLFPPFSLGLAQRKRAVHGPKERRSRALCSAKGKPGVFSDAAVETCQSPAGCGGPFPYQKFPAASRGSTAVIVLQNRKAYSPAPARYAHTRAVAESGKATHQPPNQRPARHPAHQPPRQCAAQHPTHRPPQQRAAWQSILINHRSSA